MNRRRLYFVEPSKADKYHITLIDGYIDALLSSAVIGRSYQLVVLLCRSTFANLSERVKSRVLHQPIPVVHQDRHQVVWKSLVEFYVVARCLLHMRRGDLVFISCIIPPALLMVEMLNRILRRSGVFVVIHGEIEGYIERRNEHWKSIGFWATKWMQLRRRDSLIKLVVIDDFIRTVLLSSCDGKLAADSVGLVHHPVTAMAGSARSAPGDLSVCFVGFRTRSKGFEVFQELSGRHPQISFLAIGMGKVENVRTAQSASIDGSQGFLTAISGCAAAVFPYKDGYGATLSAAALDTLSAGVHIIATARPFFVSLAEYFGSDFVTIYETAEQLDALLSQRIWLEERQAGQGRRLALLASSKYSADSVRRSFEDLVMGFAAPESAA